MEHQRQETVGREPPLPACYNHASPQGIIKALYTLSRFDNMLEFGLGTTGTITITVSHEGTDRCT